MIRIPTRSPHISEAIPTLAIAVLPIEGAASHPGSNPFQDALNIAAMNAQVGDTSLKDPTPEKQVMPQIVSPALVTEGSFASIFKKMELPFLGSEKHQKGENEAKDVPGSTAMPEVIMPPAIVPLPAQMAFADVEGVASSGHLPLLPSGLGELKSVNTLIDERRHDSSMPAATGTKHAEIVTVEGAQVLSADVGRFIEPAMTGTQGYSLSGPEQTSQVIGIHKADLTPKGTQMLNIVLSLADNEPLRCLVRNLGDAISITIAASDPTTVAYLRDNDHVLRANLENIGVQTDSVQIRLASSSSAESQDAGSRERPDLPSQQDQSGQGRRQRDRDPQRDRQSGHEIGTFDEVIAKGSNAASARRIV